MPPVPRKELHRGRGQLTPREYLVPHHPKGSHEQTTEVTRRLAIYSLLFRGTLTSISVMASNVSHGGTWDCETFYQFNGTWSEKHKCAQRKYLLR